MNEGVPASAGRDRLIDGLRGLALAGVLVVNTLSFPHVLSSPIGIVEPPDSPLAIAVHALAAGAFEAKSYPLLMFLVGYSWAMRVRPRRGGIRAFAPAAAARRAQMLRQGALGLLHGLFVYFGDILSWLALLGLMLLRAPVLRLSALRRRLYVAATVWVVIGAPIVLLAAIAHETDPPLGHWLTDVRSWPEAFALQRYGYLQYVWNLPWQMPQMLTLGLLGVYAARLRLLERARQGARWWAFGQRWLLPAGIVANGLLAVWVIDRQLRAGGDWFASDVASQFAGPLLSAAVVCTLARAWHRGGARWLAALAPLGRMTMSWYVAHTLACTLLFAGPALAAAPRLGSLGLFAFGAGFWLLAAMLSPAWQRYVGAGPLERWVRAAAPASRRNTMT